MKRVAEVVLSAAVLGMREVETGKTLDDVVDGFRGSPRGSVVADILFKYYRCRGWYDGLASAAFSASGAGSVPSRIRRVFLVALVQSFGQDGISSESAANVAVGFIRRKGGKRAAGFLNVVLRRALELGSLGDFSGGPVPSVPEALCSRWVGRGCGFAGLLRGFRGLMDEPPALTFTASSEVSDAELAGLGCSPLAVAGLTDGFRFFSTDDPSGLFRSGLAETGGIQVRDPSTVLFMALLEECGVGGWRDGVVFDLCSAPGGKALTLAERMSGGAVLVAADRSPRRLERVEENFSKRRFECSAAFAAASASEPPFSAEGADLVLLDAPCSNTGVFRRRPDVLWRFSESRLRELARLQERILAGSAPLVAPGGVLVYSTCSLEPEENELQVGAFLKERSDFELLGSRTLFPSESHDGAYAAVIRRIKG